MSRPFSRGKSNLPAATSGLCARIACTLLIMLLFSTPAALWAMASLDTMMKDPAILDKGIPGTFLLQDGSVIRGTLFWSTEARELKLKSVFGELTLEPTQIKGNLDGPESTKLDNLRACLANIRQLRAAVRQYLDTNGREGSARIEKWQKNSCYMLLLQVDHIMEEIPHCSRKWAQYRVKQSPELRVTCSHHGTEEDILKSIRKIMSSLEKGR